MTEPTADKDPLRSGMATKSLESELTIPAEIHEAVMMLRGRAQ
jgi:hypothetical protein